MSLPLADAAGLPSFVLQPRPGRTLPPAPLPPLPPLLPLLLLPLAPAPGGTPLAARCRYSPPLVAGAPEEVPPVLLPPLLLPLPSRRCTCSVAPCYGLLPGVPFGLRTLRSLLPHRTPPAPFPLVLLRPKQMPAAYAPTAPLTAGLQAAAPASRQPIRKVLLV